jgi:hypothetical protein
VLIITAAANNKKQEQQQRHKRARKGDDVTLTIIGEEDPYMFHMWKSNTEIG